MTNTRARQLVLLLAVVALSAIGLGMLHKQQGGATQKDTTQVKSSIRELAATTRLPVPDVSEIEKASLELSETDLEFIEKLRVRFAPNIHVKHAQIRLIEQVIAYLKEKYPDNWQQLVAGFLGMLFPESAETLVTRFEALMAYNHWLETHRSDLRAFSVMDRRAALWAARFATFGDDAYEIWAMDLKNQQIRDTLASLENAGGMSINEKASVYIDSIHSAYGEQALDFIQSRQTELTGHFLALDSVQQELHSMDATQRAETLRSVRLSMGMSPEAVERWSALDQRRDKRWQNGQTYMLQRDRIYRKYQGEERDQELAKLRQDTFGEEADAVRAEEESGYYRYAHKRRYGRE